MDAAAGLADSTTSSILRCAAFALAATLGCLARADGDSEARPNVIVVLSDDQGWGDLSLHGNPHLRTPNLDALARRGAQFDRFFVCPVCSPTRAEFLTGRYHPRGGVRGTSAGGERLDLDETTIAEVFREAGYATAAFGKWHNGTQPPYHPNGRGFDEFYGFCSGHWGHYFSPILDHNGERVRGQGYVANDFTNHAVSFIEANQHQPFFVYLAFNTPHSPMQVPDRWWQSTSPNESLGQHRYSSQEDLAHTQAALAMCENLDWNVGRLLSRLEELDLTQNTIVVYFCDNGPNGFRWNGDMKGHKGSTDEGGVRSPLLIQWPGTIAAGKKVTQIAAAIDLLPTLSGLAGVAMPQEIALDGVSLQPLLQDEPADWPDRTLFTQWQNRVSARTQQFRLDHEGNLFDLTHDPGQRHVANQAHPDIAQRLAAEVKQWKETVGLPLPPDDRPFPVGHPLFRSTPLPARDARAHGQITRSNRYPNCSFFTNWTELDDRITWDVEVMVQANYRVDIRYTCPPSDVNAEIELSFLDQQLRGTVTQPHESPLIGADEDRVPRIESYVKDFHTMTLGTIQLPAGKGPLTLRAKRIPGHEVMDLRSLVLTRLATSDHGPSSSSKSGNPR